MKIQKIQWLIAFIVISLSTFSQTTKLSFESDGLIRKGSTVPFWLRMNQYGKFDEKTAIQWWNAVKAEGFALVDKPLSLSFAFNGGALTTDEYSKLKILQADFSIATKLVNLVAGASPNPVLYEGLSSSNGDMLESTNFRPYPKIRLETHDFLPVPFLKQIRFYALYDEGILYDDRVIENAHLHHDKLLLRYQIGSTTKITVGVNRFVFWGGQFSNGEKLPTGFKNYLRYILGIAGGDGFLETDKLNVAGNTLGTYLVSLEHQFDNWNVEVQISHPFEDHSGMEFDNYKDNLALLYLKRRKSGSLVDAVVLECMYTKNQSGYKHQLTGPRSEHMRGLDNYFNHGVYGSGFTFMGYSMGTPLFTPIRERGGKVAGVTNNRIIALHGGANGYLIYPKLKWKALLTYTRNYGTYTAPYRQPLDQIYSLTELTWFDINRNLELTGKFGADYGQLAGKKAGFGLSFRKYF